MATLVAEKAARKKKEQPAAGANTKTDPSDNPTETTPENVVVFTSWDGTVREVGPLPPNLGRTTALASEKSVSRVWGTAEEEEACRAMQKGR